MSRPVAAEGLLHPAVLASVGVLVINDHWAKAHHPGLVTGKLSDFAGLVFFPLLLQAAWELGHVLLRQPWRPSARVLQVAALGTAVTFAAVKLWGPAGEAYRVVLGVARWPLDALAASLGGTALPALSKVSLTQDPTDVVALVAVGLALYAGRSRGTAPHPGPLPAAQGEGERLPLRVETITASARRSCPRPAAR
ncbi:MAG: hypothetical protein Q8L48_00300 [Archangium sp.]|nr:hypothetical protein [Archangium sp.]